jgi:hypothetical protein
MVTRRLCRSLMRRGFEGQDWANPILAESFELKEGNRIVPDLPGSCIVWSEEAVDGFHA